MISGCSGGGKSTVLADLQHLGHPVVAESGRRVIAQQRGCGGMWVELVACLNETLRTARHDLETLAGHPDSVFSDRGLIDAAAALAHHAKVPLTQSLPATRPYPTTVFLAPP